MAKEYTKIRFTLHMEPPRATAQGKRINRKTGAVFHTPEYQAAEAEYLLRLRQEYNIYVKDKPLPFDGPVSCCVTFRFPNRYKCNFGKAKTTKPDLDNMAKCLLDCMTKVGFWFDDAQVSFLLLEKQWAKEGSIEIELCDYTPDHAEDAPVPAASPALIAARSCVEGLEDKTVEELLDLYGTLLRAEDPYEYESEIEAIRAALKERRDHDTD